MLVVLRTILSLKVLVVIAVLFKSIVLVTFRTRPLILVHVRHPGILVTEPAIDTGLELAPGKDNKERLVNP